MDVAASIFLTAFFFAAIHFDIAGFVPLFAFGAVLAFVFERTKSIFPGMIAHACWLCLTFTGMLLLGPNN